MLLRSGKHVSFDSQNNSKRNDDSRGDRHLGYSSRHTQVSVPATTQVVLFQKQQNRRSKNNFPSKSLIDSIKCTIFAPTRTRQASSQCLNRRVVLLSYGTLFKDLHIARPVDGIATIARSPRRGDCTHYEDTEGASDHFLQIISKKQA